MWCVYGSSIRGYSRREMAWLIAGQSPCPGYGVALGQASSLADSAGYWVCSLSNSAPKPAGSEKNASTFDVSPPATDFLRSAA